ncbi:MAG: sugar ABC transporter permease [Clostridia bacterium]|nr:sugar ABC transporter permease [Clostridia bacterium]
MTTDKSRHREGTLRYIKRDLVRNRGIYLMFLPVILYFILFHYVPMYGAQIAFRDYTPRLGITGSSFVGFKHFVSFFASSYFWRLLRNTLMLSFLALLFGFPAPIILALLMNELRNKTFKRVVQTVTYLPYFISLMVVCSLLIEYLSKDGLINDIVEFFGGERQSFLLQAKYYRTIHVASGVWQNMGWNSIVYISALAAVDQQLYEAAVIDGAGRWKQTLHITLPGIVPTIVIMLIMRMGTIMNVGFEKVILLYNSGTYETADVISSFVYRKGLQEANYGYSAAVGLFNSVINTILLMGTNAISRRLNETSLF